MKDQTKNGAALPIAIDEAFGLDQIEERWNYHGYTIEAAMQAKAAYEEWAQEDVHFDCLDAAILGTNESGGLFPERLEAFFAAWIRSWPFHAPEKNLPNSKTDSAANGDCRPASCSRLFRVQVTFDTVIYAEAEKTAKQLVKYGTGEIDDMPVSVTAMPIESRDGLPAGWNAECLPWGDAPENTTIGEILNANVKGHAPAPAHRTPQNGKGGDK